VNPEDHRLVTGSADLDTLVERSLEHDVYALDTEFHREKTYFPQLALVQLRVGDELVLIDPLEVDIKPLAALLDSDATGVFHAASQDLEVLYRSCGTVPKVLFDTQIAAGFLGMSSPSLAALHEREIGIRLPKGDRLTDWLRRPLGTRQLNYAASDVAHLLTIHTQLVSQLRELGRVEWAMAECELMRIKDQAPREPALAWLRIKEARHLSGPARGVAQAVAEWREQTAADQDLPPRYILSDLAVVGVAQQQPTTGKGLKAIRGLDERHARGDVGESLLSLIQEGVTRNPPKPPRRGSAELDRNLRPLVGLVTAWLGQRARDLKLDPSLLATRADVEAALRGDEGRLSTGWRAELVGSGIEHMRSGEASVAFERTGRLCLERRSHESLE